MKNNNESAIERIISKKETLSKKQKQLCDFLIENHNKIATLTMKELADQAEVGTSTVMRTIKELNYSSFNELKKELHIASLQKRPTTWWPLQHTDVDHTKNPTNENPYYWNEILESLDHTFTNDLNQGIEETVKLMKKASRINVLGLRSSKIPASYFASLLKEFTSNIQQLSNEVEFIYDRILQMDTSEIIVVFVQSPFAVETLKAANYCYEKGIKIILITDLLSCPIVPKADITLLVETCKNQYSIVSSIALVEVLIIKYALALLPKSMKNLELLGKVLVDENVTTTYKGLL